MRKTCASYLELAILLAGFLLVASPRINAQAAPNTLPPGDGRDVVAAACVQCHSLRLIISMRDGREGWKELVDYMILRGAQILPEEAPVVVDYLTKNLGPGAGPMQSPKGAILTLPDGPGKALVQSHCTFCHDVGRITGAVRGKEEWDYTVKRMMVWAGVSTTADEVQTMSSYLASQVSKQTQ